jgi:subtilase family serine protease
MLENLRVFSISVLALAIAGCGGILSTGNMAGGWRVAADGRASAVKESPTVTLSGNVHPLARPEFDEGVVAEDMRLDRGVLALKSSPEQQATLDELVVAQQDSESPFYHQWLTPEQFGTEFGVSDADLARVTGWLAEHRFAVEEIPAGRRMIVFSGTAGNVYEAFHVEMRRYRVNGEAHIANAEDPQIPATLADVVSGVVALHDFRHRPEISMRRPLAAMPQYTAGGTHDLFPADFATIYDLNPLYGAGTAGAGVSIAIAGRSNINPTDVAKFRAMAGLAPNSPTVTLAGSDPGIATDQDEATLDVEWSGAVAPAAAINLVVAKSTATTDGVDLATSYIVNHATAPVVSVSYGTCEQEMGAAELEFYSSLWEQAASEGRSVFVASGDAGAAGCAAPVDAAGMGVAVNGLCSSPYSTCVGGTEFAEGSNAAQYWGAGNGASYGSALSYIPEQVWNESASNGGTGLWASGGGASQVYAQPAWQADVSGTSEANGMRAVPDVALAAADHDGYFMVENGSYWIASGTSASTPAFAGMMALVDEKQGGAQGNANPGLYALENSPANAAARPFHPTPTGNNSVPGVAGFTASGQEYNLATGLGSMDGALLVQEWGAGRVAIPIAVRPGGCTRLDLLYWQCTPFKAPSPRRGAQVQPTK